MSSHGRPPKTPQDVVDFVNVELVAARLEGRIPNFHRWHFYRLKKNGKNHIGRHGFGGTACGARFVLTGDGLGGTIYRETLPYDPTAGICVGCKKAVVEEMKAINRERAKRREAQNVG